MGEEEKKAEENKVEEKKAEETKEEKKEGKEEANKPEKPAEEKKAEESKEEAAAPPEVVLKVFMHCEGCARKVRRSLKGFPGVEDVMTDCKSHKVVVKGEKADPLKVLERVQRKSHRQVELLSPIPKPPAVEEKKPQEEKPKAEEKKEEIITVVLNVHMHCEACSQEIKRRIERMKGVESAVPDLKSSQVSVKGVFEAAKLVQYVHKRTGKQAVIVKQEVEKKEEAKEAAKEEKKAEEGGGDKEKKKSGEGEENKEKNEGEGGEAKPAEAGAGAEETDKVVELKRNEYYYNPPRYGIEYYAYPGPAYPPQIFSDENPNACTVM